MLYHVEITHLCMTRPDNNFFGHRWRPAGTHPIFEVPAIECIAGRGIRSDRFFDYKNAYKKAVVTFFAEETYHALCGEFGVAWTNRRRFCGGEMPPPREIRTSMN